ncbi:hypothetical protein QV65_03405 [Rhodococcus erythropolis]|nr:hypothetical protein QV65_03405 [Rhodococcus erythropolis]
MFMNGISSQNKPQRSHPIGFPLSSATSIRPRWITDASSSAAMCESCSRKNGKSVCAATRMFTTEVSIAVQSELMAFGLDR